MPFMNQPRYDAAEALVYDPVASNRSATRAALRSLGFGPIEVAPSLDALKEQMTSRTPDLLLCEVGGAENEVCALLQSVRQGQVGDDPFLVMIATTWRRDGTIVNRAINSGADDLLARPFSAALLGERLKNLIDRRKDFVVTGDYVGPDRRRDPARAGLPCIPVPNSLKTKCTMGLSVVEAQDKFADALREGKRTVNAEKIRRDATQVYAQWKAIEQKRQASRDVSPLLGRLLSLAAGIERRAPNTQFSAAEDIARSLGAVSKIVMALPAQNGSEADYAAAFEKMDDAVARLRQMVPSDFEEGIPAIESKPVRPDTPARAASADVVRMPRRATAG